MDPDELMDLAVSATKTTFGRSVTYTPQDSAAVSIKGDFQQVETTLSTDPPTTSTVPVLDVRTADLEAVGITPTARDGTRAGDVVAFSVRGELHTYDVLAVEQRSPWSTVLVLGRRAA